MTRDRTTRHEPAVPCDDQVGLNPQTVQESDVPIVLERVQALLND